MKQVIRSLYGDGTGLNRVIGHGGFFSWIAGCVSGNVVIERTQHYKRRGMQIEKALAWLAQNFRLAEHGPRVPCRNHDR